MTMEFQQAYKIRYTVKVQLKQRSFVEIFASFSLSIIKNALIMHFCLIPSVEWNYHFLSKPHFLSIFSTHSQLSVEMLFKYLPEWVYPNREESKKKNLKTYTKRTSFENKKTNAKQHAKRICVYNHLREHNKVNTQRKAKTEIISSNTTTL